jgi:hypothetical protein
MYFFGIRPSEEAATSLKAVINRLSLRTVLKRIMVSMHCLSMLCPIRNKCDYEKSQYTNIELQNQRDVS